MEFKDNLVCTGLFKFGPEALESNMTLIHGYNDHDFLNNPVNNCLVPFAPYFDCKIKNMFRAGLGHTMHSPKESIASIFGAIYSRITLIREKVTVHKELPLYFIRRKDSEMVI